MGTAAQRIMLATLRAEVEDGGISPIGGSGVKCDLAMTSAPGAVSGFKLGELLKLRNFYAGNSVVLTSASSKLSLATALQLQDDRKSGSLKRLIAYTSSSNADFVKASGLYDDVLSYEEPLPTDASLRHVLIDVAGDATVYKRAKK